MHWLVQFFPKYILMALLKRTADLMEKWTVGGLILVFFQEKDISYWPIALALIVCYVLTAITTRK